MDWKRKKRYLVHSDFEPNEVLARIKTALNKEFDDPEGRKEFIYKSWVRNNVFRITKGYFTYGGRSGKICYTITLSGKVEPLESGSKMVILVDKGYNLVLNTVVAGILLLFFIALYFVASAPIFIILFLLAGILFELNKTYSDFSSIDDLIQVQLKILLFVVKAKTISQLK